MSRPLLDSAAKRAMLALAAMAALGVAAAAKMLPPTGKTLVDTLRNDGPNETDLDNMTKNYYEGLLEMDRDSAERGALATKLASFFQAGNPTPAEWALQKEPMAPGEDRTTFLFRENIPGFDGLYKGCQFRINKWGQRSNIDYAKEKPAGVIRIAMCGGSNTMGYGVPLEDSFSYLIEQRLNREWSPISGKRYEVINFSSNGYHLPEKLYMLTRRFKEFQPDLAVIDLLPFDLTRTNYEFLATRVRDGRDLAFDFLRDIVTRANASAVETQDALMKKLKPFRLELVDHGLREARRFELESGIPLVVLILRTDHRGVSSKLHWLEQVTRKNKLLAIPVLDALEEGGIANFVHPRDYHFSASAHHKIADEIFAKMMFQPRVAAALQAPPPAPEQSKP